MEGKESEVGSEKLDRVKFQPKLLVDLKPQDDAVHKLMGAFGSTKGKESKIGCKKFDHVKLYEYLRSQYSFLDKFGFKELLYKVQVDDAVYKLMETMWVTKGKESQVGYKKFDHVNFYEYLRSQYWFLDKFRFKELLDEVQADAAVYKLMETMWVTKRKESEVGYKKLDHVKLYESRRSQYWVDKYQPKLLEDVKHQDEAVQKLRETLKLTKDHIYLYGQRGIGRTSTVLAIARKIFRSPKLYESRVLHMCSLIPEDTPENVTQRDKSLCLIDIDILLTSITKFVEAGSSKHDRCPPFRLIIIDRAEYLDEDYQKELIPTMVEASSRNVRFIFKCSCYYKCRCINEETRLVGPLAEICSSIGFKSLPHKYVKKTLLEICHKEGLSPAPMVLTIICRNARGSLGWAIALLQRAARSFRPTIYLDDLRQIDNAALTPPEKIERLMEVCKLNKFKSVLSTLNDIFQEGYSDSMYLSQLYDAVVEAKDIPPRGRNKICNCLVEADEKYREDGNDQLHMLNVAGTLMIVLSKIPKKHVQRFWLEWRNFYPKSWDGIPYLGGELEWGDDSGFSWPEIS